jgi:hypothetical protein
MRRHLAGAILLLTLAACSPKVLDQAGATKLISEHPQFAAPVDRMPLAADIVDSMTGVDAGVVDGIWKYGPRDATGRPQRVLTPKGQQIFKDGAGGLATVGRREVVDVTEIVDDKDNNKHHAVDFTWKYQIPPVAAHYTGAEGTFRGHAEFQYEGAWKVASLTLDAKPGPFAWTADLGNEVRRLLSAEQDANTQRMLALEPQRFKTADGANSYTITVADVYVSVDEETTKKMVPFIDYQGCRVEDKDGALNFRVDGLRQSIVATANAGARAELEKICGVAKEAHDSWVANHPDVAARGPLGVTYSR